VLEAVLVVEMTLSSALRTESGRGAFIEDSDSEEMLGSEA